MAVAGGVFLIALALIATKWVHRTKIALIGAALVVITHTIDQSEAIEAVGFEQAVRPVAA